MKSSGLSDKLYWRKKGDRALSSWHCFRRDKERGCFVSLCGRAQLDRVDGQKIQRPIAAARCGLCDAEEVRRRGWDESGPKSGAIRDVTDPESDAPDGAEVNGFERQGGQWIGQ